MDRRTLLRTTGAGLVAASMLPTASASDHEDDDDVLLDEDFESYSTGDVPGSITRAGNFSQQVVDSTAASGDQSYRMSGSHGGCWEAIARHPLDVADNMVISGAYRLEEGNEGCHSGSGTIKLGTTTNSSWSSGSNAQLLQFNPDGTITSHGTEVGEFSEQEWVEFEVAYRRDRENAEVTQVARIDGGEPTRVSRDERDFEDDLSALEFDSDDFTVFWDDLQVETGDIDVSGEVAVGLAPESAEVTMSGSTAFDVVAVNAGNGVSAFSFTIAVDDPSVARIVDYEYNQEPDFDNTEISSDGAEITFEAGQGSSVYEPGQQITIGSIVVEANGRGESALSFEDAELLDTQQSVYDVAETNGGAIEAITPPAIVGDRPPQDLDGDGLYRDINGDGEFDIFDVQALYANLDSDAVQNNPSVYNFDGSDDPDSVEIFDVQALFTDLQEREGDPEAVADAIGVDPPEDGTSLSFSDVEPALADR